MKATTKAYLALAVVCFFWGTTYLFMRIGVSSFPPFLFSGIRQVCAGLILWIFLLASGRLQRLSFRDIIKQAIPGLLLIACGNGLIGWSERYIPSGLAALIVSVMPVYVTLINFMVGKGRDEFNANIGLGLLLGCAGIVLIFKDNLADLARPDYLWGVIIAFMASFCWAGGTVYIKHQFIRTDSYTNAAIQFSSGGLALMGFSLIFDDYSELAHISAESIWALVYLIAVGSLFAYLCFLYAIKHLPVSLVSVYAYINPFIALLLGFVVLDEKITWVTALAFATTLSGIYWINKGHRQLKPAAAKSN